jgi:hypothetical protein
LLRLIETCTKFKKLITESTPLMEKLRIVIDINLDPAEEKKIVECIESRRFSAARLFIDNTVKEASKSRVISISKSLEGIRDVQIVGPSYLERDHFLQLTTHLLPQAKKCKIKCNASFLWDSDPNIDTLFVHNGFPHDPFQLSSCVFLTDLEVENCNIAFLSRVLLESKNLKRLSIKTSEFRSEKCTIEGTSVWQLVTFKLQKIEFLGRWIFLDKTFNKFLAAQTDLREMSITCLVFHFESLLQFLPDTTSINVGDSTVIQGIQPGQLHKFRLLAEHQHRDKPELKCDLELDDPDVNALESSLLNFLDRDTSIPGLKNGQVLRKLRIGEYSWLTNGTVVSEEFIQSLFSKIPNVREFGLWSAIPNEEIKRMIDRNGSFDKVEVSGINGSGYYEEAIEYNQTGSRGL